MLFCFRFLCGCRDASRVRRVNSVSCRISGANAPCDTMPHMSRPGCEPARCVNRAVYSSRSPGRGRCARTRLPDANSCLRRISHTQAAWNGMARLLFCPRDASSPAIAVRHGVGLLMADGTCMRDRCCLNAHLKSAHEHGLESKAAIHTDSTRINSAVASVLGAPFRSSSRRRTGARITATRTLGGAPRYGATRRRWTARGAQSSMRVARASMQPARSWPELLAA